MALRTGGALRLAQKAGYKITKSVQTARFGAKVTTYTIGQKGITAHRAGLFALALTKNPAGLTTTDLANIAGLQKRSNSARANAVWRAIVWHNARAGWQQQICALRHTGKCGNLWQMYGT